ncbi:NUDIX domain-containing protein [Shouchella clausii]|uniref:NUDIX domain-containing protein n=1 Tax=Shouchella clausii TaxID=79880 RepID=UPI000BA5B845|nr:NUDIX hydrolase [Shouchella clausii]PAD18074.1 ADP-ribose pyrophosphatase [Shouchella clausii]
MKELTEQTIAKQTIHKGKLIQLDVEDVELPDGTIAKRELVRHPGAVAVVAITEDGKMVLVEQYRKALEKAIIEIPAGKMEPGEAPEKTARRELVEETGYQAEALTLITSFYTSPGFADELVYVYEATGLKKGDQRLDEGEFVRVLELTEMECDRLEEDGRIHDAKTSYALQYWKLKNRR